MAADLGDLYARLKLDTTSLDAAGAKMAGLGNFTGTLLSPLGLAAAAVAGVGLAALGMAANYQQSTDRMAALAGITHGQAKQIADAFLTTGGQVTFSAEQIIKAYGPVSGQLGLIAGHALSANDALGFMRTAMDLAEASGKPLADTTGALAQVMQAYGIGLSGAATAADLLFNVSRNLNIPLPDLVGTLDKLHAKLGPLAPSLSDVGTLLTDVATHGLTGNRALQLVSTGLNTLLGGSKETSAEVGKLGLHLFDASGHFVGMKSIIEQLSPKLAGMTEQQRLAAEKALFGAGASKALDETLTAGLPAWDKAAKAATATGTAHQGAQTATDNLKGSLAKMGTALSDLLVAIGPTLVAIGTFLVGALMGAYNAAATFVNWVEAHWPELIPVFVLVAAALAPMVGAFVAAKVQAAISAAEIVAGWLALSGYAVAQAVITSGAWVGSAVVSSAAWITSKLAILGQYALIVAGAIGQAIATQVPWLASAATTTAAWVATKVTMLAGFVATVTGAVSNAAATSGTWVAASVTTSSAWTRAYAIIAAGAASTAATVGLILAPIAATVGGILHQLDLLRGGGAPAVPGQIPTHQLWPGGPSVPGRQFGGFVPPGQWAIAGEAGPEPIYGGRTGATVLPNEALRGGISVVNHFTLNGGDEALVQRVQQVVTRSLNDVLLAARS